MKKTLLVFLNLIAYTSATNNTTEEAFVCGDDCEEYTVANSDLQGNLTALAALEDAVAECEAANPANDTTTEVEETTTPETNTTQTQEDEEEDEQTTLANNTTQEERRALKFKTQLNGAEDPCKAQKDDLNANSTALEANIEGVNNVGITHGTPDEIETMLKAQKRLFLLSTVQPNAEAQYYGEFMEMLVAQRDLWNHTHAEEESETGKW